MGLSTSLTFTILIFLKPLGFRRLINLLQKITVVPSSVKRIRHLRWGNIWLKLKLSRGLIFHSCYTDAEDVKDHHTATAIEVYENPQRAPLSKWKNTQPIAIPATKIQWNWSQTRVNVRLYVLESVLGWSVERLGPFYSGYLSPNSLTMDIFAIRIIRLHFAIQVTIQIGATYTTCSMASQATPLGGIIPVNFEFSPL